MIIGKIGVFAAGNGQFADDRRRLASAVVATDNLAE